MLRRALAFALILTIAGVSLSPEIATAQSRQGQSLWLRTESQHFEIHYLPTLARDVERVVRSAERAYDHISGRLEFVFAKKVPLVMSATTGPLTRDEIVAYPGMVDCRAGYMKGLRTTWSAPGLMITSD